MRRVASVRPKSGSQYFFACFKLPTGALDGKGRPIFRRVQRSTRSTDETRALQLAISYERAAVLASEKRWQENSARRFLDEIRGLTGASIGEVEPADAFLRRWLASRKGNISARTWDKYAAIVSDFIIFLGPQAAGPLIDVTSTRCAAFRDAESAGGNGPATVNKALMVLGQAFAEAVRTGLLEQNPARGINVRGGARRRQHRRPFTFAQFQHLVSATEGEWRTLILVCGYTGARQQEAAKLTWEQVDLRARRVTLSRAKTGDLHWIPMHAALHAHLAGLRKRGRRTGYLMPDMAARKRMGISNPFRRVILPSIGIKQPYAKQAGSGRKLAEYSLHSLRHSLSTWLQAAGVDEMMRMRLIGHEDKQVSRGYTHTEFAAAAEELAKVPAIAS